MPRINFDDVTRATGADFVDRPIKGPLTTGAIIEHTMAIPVPGLSSTIVASLLEMALTDTRVPTQEFRVVVGNTTIDSFNAQIEQDENPNEWLVSVIQGLIAKAQEQHHVSVR